MRDLTFHTLSSQLINYFGRTALLFQNDTVTEIIGILDQVSIETLEIDNHQALFTVASQHLPANLHGCTLKLNNQCYQIVEVQPDGAGAVTLVLEELT